MPAFNEEKNIAPLITKIAQLGYQVLVCDDASTDSTVMIAEKMGAIVIRHTRNLGYGATIQSIFNKARELNCDVLVTIDADGQHNYQEIKDLVKPIQDDDADLVIGSRFLGKKTDMPKYRKIGIKTLTKITNAIEDLNITDSQSGFRAYSKKAITSIFPVEDSMGVSTEILVKASQKKLRIIEVPIVVSYEGDTSTQNPASHGMSVLGTSLKLISIKHPLGFYGIPGLSFIGLGIFFTIITLTSFSETRDIITNQALLAIGSFLFGLVLLVTGIILFSIISVIRER